MAEFLGKVKDACSHILSNINVKNLTIPSGESIRSVLNCNDAEFVELAYQIVLDRQSDSQGAAFYVEKISKGEISRRDFIQSLVYSNEFLKGHRQAAEWEYFAQRIPVGSADKYASHVKTPAFKGGQLNEIVNPRKWLEPKWQELAQELQIVPTSIHAMHKKTFEWVQTIYGLTILDRLSKSHLALGVGSGHECIVYWLARHFQRVYATDLFQGAWTTQGGMEGDNAVLKDPDKYRPFDYPRERLRFLPMDGGLLAFKDDSFEVVFSLSSIEHFGGKEMSARAMREIGRVLKPGGVAVVATEYVLNGVEHPEFFNERDLLQYVVNPCKLELVQDICFEVPSFLLDKPLVFPDEKYRSPQLSLMDGEAIFTSIILFFEKSNY